MFDRAAVPPAANTEKNGSTNNKASCGLGLADGRPKSSPNSSPRRCSHQDHRHQREQPGCKRRKLGCGSVVSGCSPHVV